MARFFISVKGRTVEGTLLVVDARKFPQKAFEPPDDQSPAEIPFRCNKVSNESNRSKDVEKCIEKTLPSEQRRNPLNFYNCFVI